VSQQRGNFAFRSDRYAWYVVSVLCLASIVGQIDRQIIALLVEPLKADFGLSDTRISVLQGLAFALFFVIVAVPIGRVADAANRKVVISVGALLWSVATALCGLARDFWQLFFARMGVGVGEATLGPATFSMISDYFPREKLARALAVFVGSSFVGTGIALLVGGTLVAWAGDVGEIVLPVVGTLRPWQLAFIAAGSTGILVLLLLPSVREPPRHGLASDPGAQVKHVPLQQIARFVVAHRGAYFAIYGGFSVIAAMNFALGAWVPTFFVRVYGWSPGEIGQIYGLYVMTFGALGVLAGGWLTDRLHARGHADANLRAALYACLPALPLVAAMPLAGNPIASLVLLAPVAFLGTVPFGAGPAAIPLITPNRMRAQLVAAYYLVANLVGVAFGPWIVAFFTDYVFKDESLIGYSLSMACSLLLGTAVLILLGGAGALRRTMRLRLAAEG
jgi:MFS family permease